jgi:1-acyl-sn-glycerol-3-phosphate acyltransferase
MSFTQQVVMATLRGLTSLLCRIDAAQLERVPEKGPLIIVTNHVNILEIPITFSRLWPRPVTGLGAAVRWDNFLTRWLLNLFGAIPLHRGTADIGALRRAIELLRAGSIILIAPEGTRSGHGRLQKAHAGVVSLALRGAAPLLPVVFYGSENYRQDLRRLRRADFHIVVGRPFRLDAGGRRVTRQMRQEMLDEVMVQLATLLPPAYRGVYADTSSAGRGSYLAF